MNQNNDTKDISKGGQVKESPRPQGADGRKVFSAAKLELTPPRTADDIKRHRREGRFAEMTPRQAGIDD